MVVQYKCPHCGSDMAFSPKVGKLHCESCNFSEDISDRSLKSDFSDYKPSDFIYDAKDEDQRLGDESFEQDYYDFNHSDSESTYHHFNATDINEHECNNCGAKIITDTQTTSTSCTFCGAAMVLANKFNSDLAPSLVIPFKITKQEAGDAFKKWCKNGRLTPNGFMTADRIANITGLYVPYWLFDLNARGEIQATCTKVRTYSKGNYDITETKFYNVYRKIDLNYLKIPCDASKKMEDGIMDKLEPFHYNELKSFNLPYLAGYLSEKYDYKDTDLLSRARQRTNRFVDSYIGSTINGYSSIKYNYKDIQINQRNSYYTLLPVWVVYYNYNNKEYIFSMNGQTGKVAGKPPISFSKVFKWFSGISLLSFVIMRFITLLLLSI